MTLERMSDEQILAIANPIMDNLMEASTAIDHERHVRDFTERLKSFVTREHLRRVCENYQGEKGYFSRREPIAVFKRSGAAALITTAGFSCHCGKPILSDLSRSALPPQVIPL